MSKTLLALPLCLVAVCLFAVKCRADEPRLPVDETIAKKLTRAIERLAQQKSYRWTTESAVPKEVRFRPGPVTGVTVRGGVTHVTRSFGPRSMQVVIEDNKAAVTSRDGRWETVSLSDQGYGSGGFAASMARDTQTPVAEANELVSTLTSLDEEGDVLIGILPADAAAAHLTMRRGNDSVRDATGTVRFSINDGLLTSYVLRVEGRLVDDGQTRKTWQQITVEVKDVGTAKLELPDGAAAALNRPIPKAQPRLSDAEEAALFKLRGKRDVGVHDPSSIVKCDGEYWFFSTGTGVSSWRSKDLRTWERGPRVFPEIPNWVTDVVPDQRGHFWAPDVIQVDDRFLLYYSVSSFGKNTSAIALASTPTLNPADPAFGWTDHRIVIQSSSGDDFNAIDPDVSRTGSGHLWMSFGSF